MAFPFSTFNMVSRMKDTRSKYRFKPSMNGRIRGSLKLYFNLFDLSARALTRR